MKKLKKLIISLFALAVSPLPALAVIPTDEPTSAVPTTGIFSSFGTLLGAALNVAFALGVAISVIFLIIGGIRWATAGGDKMAAESARKTVTNAVIGFIIVIAVFAIKSLVQTLLGAGIVPILPGW